MALEIPAKSRLPIVLAYTKSFVGMPYIWGGAHPSLGYDCSGLVQEFLAAGGLDPAGDQTAQSLYSTMKDSCKILLKSETEAGALVFFGNDFSNLTHVAFAIDERHMIEAGGGGRSTKTVQDAIARVAFVRVRPIDSRKDFVACLLPKY